MNILKKGTIVLCIVVFFISVFFIFLGKRSVLGGNEGAHFYTIRSLVQFHSFDISQELINNRESYLAELSLDASKYNGKTYSNKPPGFPFIIYPFYYLFYTVFKNASIGQGFVFCKIINIVFISVALGLIFLLSKKFFTDTRLAIVTALICGLGTNILAYSTLLVSSCASILFYIMSIQSAFLYIDSEYKKKRYLFLFSLFSAYSILIDYSNIFAIILISFYLFYKAMKKGHIVFFIIPYAFIGIYFCYYHYRLFGNPFIISYYYYQPPAYVHWGGITDAFKSNFFMGFGGLTFSASRGVFIYSPVLIFAFFGTYKMLKIKDIYSILAIVSLLSMLTAMSFYKFWHGGHSIGHRHILTVVPILAIFTGLSYEHIRTPILKLLFIFLLFFSVIVNISCSLIQKEPDLLMLTWKEEPKDIHSNLYTKLITAYLKSKR